MRISKIAAHAIVAMILVIAVVASPASASSAGRPVAAFTDDAGNVRTIDRLARPVAAFGSLQDRYSLGGDVLAGLRGSALVVFDASSGQRLSRVRSAVGAPVVYRGGRRVLFVGGFARDHQVNSVWVHNVRTGRTRKVVQFSTGGPGVETGFEGENALLEMAVDGRGTTAVVVQGNDVDLFIYDVWAVDVATGRATRLTRGRRSRHASISPDGRRVALLRQDVDGFCGGPAPGYRAGDIVLVRSDGAHRRVLVDGRCDGVFYDQPRWLDDHTLVARRLTRRAGHALRDSELVRIDTRSGAISKPFSRTRRVGNFTASATTHLVAYDDFTRPGFWMYDASSRDTRVVPSGAFPHLAGEHLAMI